ncbi:MAG: hypothetical protein KKA64_01850 [Nanoarchaeota archaeon]|nr:hypothetical protein [Nanoarchaeota archaeon]
MIDLENLKNACETQSRKVIREMNKQSKKIDLKQQKEIEKVKIKYQKLVQEQSEIYQQQIMNIEEDYYRNASMEILSQLEADYQILQERVSLDGLSQDEIKKFNLILKAYKLIEENLELPSPITFTKKNIFSYFTLEGKEYNLLTPTKEKNTGGLTKSLEDKLGDILTQENISIGLQTNKDNRGVIYEGNEINMKFSSDYDLINGFICYTIAQKNCTNDEKEIFCNHLVNKLESLQPNGFKDANLTHKIMQIDSPILQYFKTHPLNETSLQDQLEIPKLNTDRNREIDPKIRRNYPEKLRLNFSSYDTEGIRAEALQRAQDCEGEYLSTKQLLYVLGQKHPPHEHTLIGKNISRKKIIGKKKIYYLKSEIIEFIQTAKPTISKWRE